MKSWKWWHIVAIILEVCGAVFMILSLTTDTNDDTFLPVALSCVGGANLLLLVMNTRQQRGKKKQ